MIFSSLFFFLSLFFHVQSGKNTSLSSLQLPDSITGTESVYSIGTSINFYHQQGQQKYKIATIDEKILSIRKQFNLYGKDKQLIAVATRKIISINNKFIVNDASQRKLGEIAEPIAKNWSPFYGYLHIYNLSEQLLWVVRYYRFLSIFVQVFDNQGQLVAQMQRSFGLFERQWDIQWISENKKEIKKERIMHMFIPALISDIYKKSDEKAEEVQN